MLIKNIAIRAFSARATLFRTPVPHHASGTTISCSNSVFGFNSIHTFMILSRRPSRARTGIGSTNAVNPAFSSSPGTNLPVARLETFEPRANFLVIRRVEALINALNAYTSRTLNSTLKYCVRSFVSRLSTSLHKSHLDQSGSLGARLFLDDTQTIGHLQSMLIERIICPNGTRDVQCSLL